MFWKSPQDDRNLCIICMERTGTLRTQDGMVCGSCMPAELAPAAGSLRKHNIILYQRTYPDWVSFGGNARDAASAPIEDRSAAITRGTHTTLADELNAQMADAESIDIVVSFIIMSGTSLLLSGLREFSRRGKIRIITTSYMGVTEYAALNELFSLPNTEVRMELCADRGHLHAKSFIFGRSGGRSTAFVGSANISKTALTEGEEWVVKLREQDVPEVLSDLRRSYEELWNSSDVRPVTEKNRAEIEIALERRGK